MSEEEKRVLIIKKKKKQSDYQNLLSIVYSVLQRNQNNFIVKICENGME